MGRTGNRPPAKRLERSDFSVPVIGHQLRETYNAWVRHSEKELKQFDLTLTMSLVLIRLWLENALTQKELIEHTALMQSGTSGVLKTLVSRGLVLSRPGKEDGREVRYSLTRKGLTLVERLAPVSLGVRELALRGLTSEEVRQVQELLGRIKANLT
jgi:DNA-binding MarR family transcriptional regulator